MKLFILKLLSLVVLCLGLLSLFYAMGFSEVTDYVNLLPGKLEAFKENLPEGLSPLKVLLTVNTLWLLGSTFAIVLGIYGFFPQFSKWKKAKKITYQGPHGQVQIQLDTVERRLNDILARMPEIKKIHVTVEPKDGGRSALIKAHTILNQLPGENARSIAGLVSDYIAETATKMLGLEELATIELNVTGINVNTRKSSKAIRKESLSHSGNAPVELLEASPKPMALSAPGEPLGSGPIEEEMEEEDAIGDAALEARAVDSSEEDSRQAAARSELLEPLSLHPQHEHLDELGDATTEDPIEEDNAEVGFAKEEIADEQNADEESFSAIEEHSVDGSAATVSVVPEPLGDLGDDADESELDDEEFEDDGEDASSEEHEDVVVPGGDLSEGPEINAPEAYAAAVQEVYAPSDVEVPEEDLPEAVVAEETSEEVESSEAISPNSPWAPLDSDSDDAGDEILVPEPLEAIEASYAGDDEEDSESTDSVFGDMEGAGDEETPMESENDEAEGGDDEGQSEKTDEPGKKKWGWFN